MSAVTAAGEVPFTVDPITEPFFSLLSQPAAFSPPAFFFFGRVVTDGRVNRIVCVLDAVSVPCAQQRS